MKIVCGSWPGCGKKHSSAPMSMNGKVPYSNTYAHRTRMCQAHGILIGVGIYIVMSTISINVPYYTVIWRQIYTMANKNKNVNFHLIELIGGFQVV